MEMRVKTVKYERLFSFEKYQNHRIGFEVELNEHDDEAAILGELYFKVLGLHTALEVHRKLMEVSFELPRKISSVAEKLRRVKEDLAEIEAARSKLKHVEDEEERYQLACKLKTEKSLQRNKIEYEDELDELTGLQKEVDKAILETRKLIFSGDFEEVLERYKDLLEQSTGIISNYYY